ncbi:hypothetical protein DL98DRAFT_599441 [Cadophora sp. DSE1049]|nr:hypothetical protein DL98DRAFT_599441 [Cadophora sp. DSE1049]
MNKLWILSALFHYSSAGFNGSSLSCGEGIDINSITLSDNTLARYMTVKSADIPQCAIDCNNDDTCNAFASDLAGKSCFLFSRPMSYTFQKTGPEMYWDMGCLTTSSRLRTSTTTLSSATPAVV